MAVRSRTDPDAPAAVASTVERMSGPRRAAFVLASSLVLAACQTASDQLVDLPPDEVGAGGAVTDEPADCETAEPLVGGMPDLHPSVDGYDEGVVRLEGVDLDCGFVDVPVRLATTADERAHGLMEVPSLPDGVGMWFAGWDDDRTGGFWMKDTLVPLDIAYVAADGRVVDVVAMDPCEAEPCPTYPPDAPYRTTLEVSQGWFAEVGLDVGDEARLVVGG